MRLYRFSIRLFLIVYILAAILNLKNLDFCGNHTDPLTQILSFAAYALIIIITETELFLIKDITRLWVCFVFWAVHLFILVMCPLVPTIGVGLAVMIISPCLGLETVFPAKILTLFCLIEFAQLAAVLLRDRYLTQKG